jgi:outer membrane protein assembly factor BamB
MVLVPRACSFVLACAFAVAGLAGCGGVPHMVCACPARPKPAYALDVTMAGQVRWQVPLGLPGSGQQPSPLAVGAVAVFAQSDVLIRGRAGGLPGSRLYGLRLADGHRLWSRVFSQDIADMWRWRNLVVVLTRSGDSGGPVLAGLDASTGRARWMLSLGGVVDVSSPTADGGLAIEVSRGDGVLEVLDLSSGRIRWARPVDGTELPPVALGGGAVVFADSNSKLTSYDDRTGQVRWTLALPWISLDPSLMQASGLVYLTGHVRHGAGGQPTQMLVGIGAADGRLKWRFKYGPYGSLDPYAPGLMSVTGNSGRTSQDELNPATGRVRWKAFSPYPAVATPAGIVAARGPDQISMRDTRTGQIRWTARMNGGWLPIVAGPIAIQPATGIAYPALPVLPARPLLVVPAHDTGGSDLLAAFRMSDGHRTWQVTTGAVAAPLSGTPWGILVYTD